MPVAVARVSVVVAAGVAACRECRWSGSPCAPCVASATPSASAASSPSLAEANGAFGASSLTAAPEWLYDFGRKTGRYPAKILDYEKKQGAGYNGHETACAIVTYHE